MMKHEQTLHIRQGAQLTLTTKLQQAISLLQLSTAELNQFISQQMMENPLLYTPEDAFVYDSQDHLPSSSISNTSSTENDDYFDHSSFSTVSQNSIAPLAAGASTATHRISGQNNPNYQDLPPIWKSEMTLNDYLLSQIRLKFPDPTDQQIALIFCELLDEKGFITQNWQEELQKIWPKNHLYAPALPSINVLEQILAKLQTFEPCGIFATSVLEALKLQLLSMYQEGEISWDPYQISVLLEAFWAIKNSSFEKVCKKFQLSPSEFQKFLTKLRHLNFAPLEGFEKQEAILTVTPDVIMYKTIDEDIAVILSPAAIPKVLLNSAYYNDLKKRVLHAKDIAYLKEQFSSANWLIQSLQKRTVSLLQVSIEIAKWQKTFLLYGQEMKPMTLKDIAAAAGVHESTVSRITSSKYVETPKGIFELKSFFVNSVGEEDSAASSSEIQNTIRSFIADENKSKPLSDEDLVKLLDSKNLTVARRTIAKYRMILGIGSSSERKKYYKMMQPKDLPQEHHTLFIPTPAQSSNHLSSKT